MLIVDYYRTPNSPLKSSLLFTPEKTQNFDVDTSDGNLFSHFGVVMPLVFSHIALFW